MRAVIVAFLLALTSCAPSLRADVTTPASAGEDISDLERARALAEGMERARQGDPSLLATAWGAFGAAHDLVPVDVFLADPTREPSQQILLANDFDGDGRDDLLLLSSGGGPGFRLSARSGQTGALLWIHEVPEVLAQFRAAGDLDGDGRDDILIMSYAVAAWTLRALSGEGVTLWAEAYPIPPQASSAFGVYPASDHTGDGRPDVVVNVVTFYIVTTGSAVPTAKGQLIAFAPVAFVLSGVDGEPVLTRTATSFGYLIPLMREYRDVTGDGRADLVWPVTSSPGGSTTCFETVLASPVCAAPVSETVASLEVIDGASLRRSALRERVVPGDMEWVLDAGVDVHPAAGGELLVATASFANGMEQVHLLSSDLSELWRRAPPSPATMGFLVSAPQPAVSLVGLSLDGFARDVLDGSGTLLASESWTCLSLERSPVVGDYDGDGAADLLAPVRTCDGQRMLVHLPLLARKATTRPFESLAPPFVVHAGDLDGDRVDDVLAVSIVSTALGFQVRIAALRKNHPLQEQWNRTYAPDRGLSLHAMADADGVPGGEVGVLSSKAGVWTLEALGRTGQSAWQVRLGAIG